MHLLIVDDILKSPSIRLLDHPLYVKNQLKEHKFGTDEKLLTDWNQSCVSIPEEK